MELFVDYAGISLIFAVALFTAIYLLQTIFGYKRRNNMDYFGEGKFSGFSDSDFIEVIRAQRENLNDIESKLSRSQERIAELEDALCEMYQIVYNNPAMDDLYEKVMEEYK